MTFRELIEMAVGRLRSEWERTAQISFICASAAAGGKKLEYKNFNPFFSNEEKNGIEFEENIEIFRKDFVR